MIGSILKIITQALGFLNRFLNWRKSPEHKKELDDEIIAKGDSTGLDNRIDKLP